MIPSQSLEYHSCTENYLKGSVVCSAKGSPNSTHFVRGTVPDTLCWNVVDPAFLSEAGHKAFAPAASATRPALPRLPSFRDDPGHSLCHHRWDGAGQRDTDPPIQRGLPENCGTQPVPGPDRDPKIPQAANSQANPPDRTSPRSSAEGPFRSALQTDQHDLRFGFHSSGGLRQVCRRISGGIQPQETWPALLPSSLGFRVPFPRVLAWFSASRRCRELHRGRALYQSLPGQGAQTYSQGAYPFPHGLGVLWEAGGRIPRRKRTRIRDCGQSQKARPCHSQSPGLQIHTTPKRLGGRRVLVPTPQMGKATPLCGGASAHPGGAGGSRPVDSLQGTSNMPTISL